MGPVDELEEAFVIAVGPQECAFDEMFEIGVVGVEEIVVAGGGYSRRNAKRCALLPGMPCVPPQPRRRRKESETICSMNDSNEVIGVYLTFPDDETADRIARALVDSRLVACVNIFGAGRSVYRWEQEVVSGPEVFAWAKTTRGCLEDLQAKVTELHPFEVPCAVAYPSQGGLPAYLDWVIEETADARDSAGL